MKIMTVKDSQGYKTLVLFEHPVVLEYYAGFLTVSGGVLGVGSVDITIEETSISQISPVSQTSQTSPEVNIPPPQKGGPFSGGA